MDRARRDDHDIFTRRVLMGWSDIYWRDTDHPERPFLWVMRDDKIIYTSTHKDWSGDSAAQISSLGRILWAAEHNSATYGVEGSVYHEHSGCQLRFSTEGHHLRLLDPDESTRFLWRTRAAEPGEDEPKLIWGTITEILCAAQND